MIATDAANTTAVNIILDTDGTTTFVQSGKLRLAINHNDIS